MFQVKAWRRPGLRSCCRRASMHGGLALGCTNAACLGKRLGFVGASPLVQPSSEGFTVFRRSPFLRSLAPVEVHAHVGVSYRLLLRVLDCELQMYFVFVLSCGIKAKHPVSGEDSFLPCLLGRAPGLFTWPLRLAYRVMSMLLRQSQSLVTSK